MAAAMTRNPFARIAQRIGATVERRLANAVATWQGGDPFGVLFERRALGVLGDAVGGHAVSCGLQLFHVPGICQGAILEIDGVAWRVAEPVQPDESGWATLSLGEVIHD